LVVLTWVGVVDEAAPQPASSAAAMTAAAIGVRSPLAKVATPASCRTGGPLGRGRPKPGL